MQKQPGEPFLSLKPLYAVEDTSAIFTPALLLYKDLIRRNISRALELAGGPARLRPHAKTHKMREIIRLELEQGITKHKCATIAEAEMIADCGAREVFLAYNPVGPNCTRMAQLARAYPKSTFSVTADHPEPVQVLSREMVAAGQQVEVLLDLDVGMHRTGIEPGETAVSLYELIHRLPGLVPGGLHVYDGHNRQTNPVDRETAVRALLEPVLALRRRLEDKGLPVPRVVAGGTPTFPAFARLALAGLECSPGTLILNDHGYATSYTDLGGFTPAAVLLTRVISRPAQDRLTLDLGYKAVASDPPAAKRCFLLNVPDAELILQSEEHLVVRTPEAARFSPGDEVYALPEHICPTCAMHRQAYVVENGRIAERWEIVARDRFLSI